jgi:ribosomal protein S18 acetylase RimI-like enzyme
VASALWSRGIHRCEEIGEEKIHVCLHENFRAARDFFTQFGFSPVRVHLELERDLEGVLKLTEEPEIGQVAHFDEGDEPLLAELQNRIFAGSWGFCPNSAEEIKYYLDLIQCQVRDVLLLKDGNKVIGYLWSHASIGGDSALKSGRIHMFGITGEFQGRGFGKKLLRIGLEDMKKKGFGIVELTVDEENPPAIALYDTFDFREKFTSIWYEKLNKC